jgi:hypothetical protein
MNLLTIGNPKTQKGNKLGYLTAVLHFAPADMSGHEVCPMSTAACRAACLNTAGRGGIFKKGETTNVIQEARKRRTRLFFADRDAFMLTLTREIMTVRGMAQHLGLKLAVRLNGTSDLPWEKFRMTVDDVEYRNIMALFPDVQFYDYTKIANRALKSLGHEMINTSGDWPSNYHLTFSAADGNHDDARLVLSLGGNVAVVAVDSSVAQRAFPHGTMLDGDTSDLRFLDPAYGVAVLTPKGRAKKDTAGFVLR